MTPLLPPPVKAVRASIPRSIWMPAPMMANMPDCYHGTPLEMVEQMAHDMKPGMGVHDAIDLLILTLADERKLRIDLDIPADTSEAIRAAMFVYALLLVGIAEEIPEA